MIYEPVAISIVPRFPIAIPSQDSPVSIMYREFFEYCQFELEPRAFVQRKTVFRSKIFSIF